MRKATCGGLLVLCGFMMACAPPNPGGAGSLAARVDPGSYRCEPGHDKDQSDKDQTRARVSSAGMGHGWIDSCEGDRKGVEEGKRGAGGGERGKEKRPDRSDVTDRAV